MTMVERVARAMWDKREAQFPERVRLKFDPMPGDPIWPMARAAIAAMGDPTPEMVAAAAVATVPLAQRADIELAMKAADIAVRHPSAPPGISRDHLAAGIATMWPAMRSMIAAALAEG
jgi:hypothetical protein